jgi:4-alpha-glucanotransferase
VSAPEPIRAALDLLGIRNLLFGIHDAAFPSRADEDVGRGSPYSDGAAELLAFVAELGFSGVQLGPQGATSPGNASPYDGTLFSRNPLSLALGPLTRPEWGALMPSEELAELVASRPASSDRVPHAWVHRALEPVHAALWERFKAARVQARESSVVHLAAELDAFGRTHAGWLARDGLYHALERANGGRHWREWSSDSDRRLFDPEPGDEAAAAQRLRARLAEHLDTVDSWSFVQFLLHRQHRELQDHAQGLGLKLFGDLQVGLSPRDEWAARACLMRGYRMGAPPSRTNPEGQAWNHAVLDPRQYVVRGADGGPEPGAALRFLHARMEKMFAELDGVRIDHPHGFVCPWVYRAHQADPVFAVQNGARLFSSPDLPDHPELAEFSIAHPDQLDLDGPRHADGWVRELEGEQVDRYGVLFDAIVAAARAPPPPRPPTSPARSSAPSPIPSVGCWPATGWAGSG